MQAGQVGTKIREDLPPGRRKLARTLVALYKRMNEPTLEQAAKRLERFGYKKYPSEFSRYLNGGRVPPLNFVTLLYDLAVEEAGLEAVGMTKEDVCATHAKAEPTLCKVCPRLRNDKHDLNNTIKQLRVDKAGLESALAAAQKRAAHLPVPLPQRDRQRSAQDVAAARQIANRAVKLHDQGKPDAALAVLRETTEVLTPSESAASLVVLRQQHADLADTFLRIYGRDQPRADVMRVALELHDYGMPNDASAILRAAVG
ncbi:MULTISPECIES: hypothetical protein [Streptomyces]|uniref:hypothetical protein n=1 Tax=Streptomyces TaxID=1883 RepID=UPI000B9ECB31|nr:hypothetical protein [Streptomyces kasugaensis]